MPILLVPRLVAGRQIALFAGLLVAFASLSGRDSESSLAETRTFTWNGRTRTYSLFVPQRHPSTPQPVMVLHHGTGGSGAQMLKAWQELARKQKVVLVAPDGKGKFGWSVPDDGPEMEQHILESLRQEYPIDPRRIYLFGFSAGGDFVFYAALQQSSYFAAACIHDASLRPRQFPMLDLAERKIPIYYSVGIEDAVYPLAEARATEKALKQRKWPMKMVENPSGHFYNPGLTNPECWDYLKKKELPYAPKTRPLSKSWLSYALD